MTKAKLKEPTPHSAPVELPADPEIEWIELDPDVKYYRHSQVAVMLGVHRVTLLRMEQRRVIPLAKWAAKPVPHRVYTRDEVTKLRTIITALNDAKDREYVE